jgi:hypothetical protein
MMRYTSFEKFIFRCPILPLNMGDHVPKNLFKEAIYIASQSLYEAYKKSSWEDDLNPKASGSIKKYKNRMTSRCTPFGLFSGTGIGTVGKMNRIRLNGLESFRSTTRLDMDIIYEIASFLRSDEEIRANLLYYPNRTLYRVVATYRYIEYKTERGIRNFNLSSVEADEFLEVILKTSEHGATLNQLIEKLTGDFELAEVQTYLDSLIENQILVSNLEPTITGCDPLNKIIETIEGIPNRPQTDILKRVRTKLNFVDSLPLGTALDSYEEIENLLMLVNCSEHVNGFLQKDLFIKAEQATISFETIQLITETLNILNRLSTKRENSSLAKFKTDFYKRYGDEEVSLPEALDPDYGIGFSNLVADNTDLQTLLEKFPEKMASESGAIEFSPADLILLSKFHEAINTKSSKIEIKTTDVEHLQEDWSYFPFTFYSMVEFLENTSEGQHPLLRINVAGGASAANLFSRFCHLDIEIEKFVLAITEKERELAGERSILAEIVHIPKNRLGNVLLRPLLREFEIHYCGNGSAEGMGILPLSDLFISVPNGKNIRLRSKQLNKDILPRLTTAQNFLKTSLPVFNFLCVFQTNEAHADITFSWHKYFREKPYLPRVHYRSVILAPATWNFTRDQSLELTREGVEEFKKKFRDFAKANYIPEKVYLVQPENKLLIDLRSEGSLSTFFYEIRNKNFCVEEFIFSDKDSLIESAEGKFTNELILAFHRTS